MSGFLDTTASRILLLVRGGTDRGLVRRGSTRRLFLLCIGRRESWTMLLVTRR